MSIASPCRPCFADAVGSDGFVTDEPFSVRVNRDWTASMGPFDFQNTRTAGMAAGSAAVRRRSPRAVCIDDDSDFMTILGRQLRSLGVDVVSATNAVLGMRAIVRDQPDVVITDYYMPNAFGTYLLRRLQQADCGTRVPVIVVTGRDLLARVHPARNTTLEQELRHLGAYSILRKPLDRQALAESVSRCLSSSGWLHSSGWLQQWPNDA